MPLSFYDNNNRMDDDPPYVYDAAGNLFNDGVHTYAYDAEDRLISVDGGATASYVYDAEGRRVHENVGGVVKEYIYGQSGQELSVVDANQNLLQGETYFGGRYLGAATPSGFAWAQTDELGTVRARTNASGGLTETDTSWPFGEYLNQVGVTSNLHFTGKYRDGETGLDYFGARYYSSKLGRFLTPDWSESPEAVRYADLTNPQSLNLYSYVLNNPATATDPDGHCCEGWTAAAYRWISGILDGFTGQPSDVQRPAPPDARARLIEAQDAARIRYVREPGGATFCNLACAAIARAEGGPLGPLVTKSGVAYSANQIAARLAISPDYRAVTPAEAQDLANHGKLVIATLPGGGHVATVRPIGVAGDQVHPFSRGPLINNIGYDDQVDGVNWAFPANQMSNVRYYTPVGGGGH